MAVPEINQRLLSELEALEFPVARATRALYYSGNSSIEAAVNWLFDHENDPDIDQMPLVPVDIIIEATEPSHMTEQVKLEAQELRDQAQGRKEEAEKKLERETEEESTELGEEPLEAKRIAEEDKRRRFPDPRQVEKEEEERARDKIRQKLEQDKLERRWKIGPSPEGPASVKSTALLMQEKENVLPVKSAPLQFIATRTELMRNCLISLKRNHKNDDAKLKRAFQTLLIYVRNVTNNPDVEKFRKIRFRNPAFQDRVGNLKEGNEFLELCGFEKIQEGEFLYLPRDKVDMAVLRSAGTVLDSALTNPFFGAFSR